MGGLSKKAYQFSKLVKEENLPYLIVDGGSLLFNTNSVSSSREQQDKITAEGIVKAYNLTGYDAVGVSSRDLAAGLDFLQKIAKKSQFAWLSCNITNKTNGKPLFKSTISRKLGNIKIGVTALTNQLPPNSKLLDKNTEIEPWQDTLPEIVNQLTKDHDFIILLTSLSARESREIAKTYPSINLIIHAKNSDASQRPINLTETTTMVRTGKKGKYVGSINIKWYPGSKWQDESRQILASKKIEKERLTRQLSLMEDTPNREYKSWKLRNKLKEIEATIEKIVHEKKSYKEHDSPASSYKNRFIPIRISIPNHPAVQEVVSATKSMINKLNWKSATNSRNNKLKDMGFIGWQECRECHNDPVKNWQKTRHASSFLTLIEKGQQFNLNCLPCHVTGVDINDPAAAINMPPYLQVVGCETCHGPGASHSNNPTSNKPPPVTEKICMNCHVTEHDESFNFTRDIKRLKCKR